MLLFHIRLCKTYKFYCFCYWCTYFFRIHLHLLSGALLALIFPVTNTRNFALEKESYWVHHLLLYTAPIYLISCGGNFTPEPLMDIWWSILSIGVGFLYHFIVLQSLALVCFSSLSVVHVMLIKFFLEIKLKNYKVYIHCS